MTSVSVPRSRAWCFTWNHYTEDDYDAVKAWECKYLIVGKEVGGEAHTPHLQGYVCFDNARRLPALKKLGKKIHFEVARGTPKQASEYCTKDGDVFEKGERPLSQVEKGDTEIERWAASYKAVEEGRYDDIPRDIICRNLKSVEYAVKRTKESKRNLADLDGDLEHLWLVGPPRTGKSKWARLEYPNAYIKDPQTAWWDGYDGQEEVIIDDFDKLQWKQGGDMKRWLDRYKFQAQCKGGQTLIRPRIIVVTSNYRPEEVWDDPITVQAVTDRVKIVPFIKDEIVEPGPLWSEDVESI